MSERLLCGSAKGKIKRPHGSEGALENLLSGRVPDLQLDYFIICPIRPHLTLCGKWTTL